MEDNITLTQAWKPIGVDAGGGVTTFEGYFAGNSKTISNMKIRVTNVTTSGEGWQFYSYSNQYVLSVPNDVSPTVKDATVEILSRSITAESSEDYISCTGWYQEGYYFYAQYGLRTFTVEFKLASGAQASYNEYTSLTVLYGEEITVKRYTNADYIFYYEFTVTNDSGSKVWTKCFMNDRKYELENWGDLEKKTWTITEDTTITLNTTEKEYGSIWL